MDAKIKIVERVMVFLFFDGVRVTKSVMLEENLYLYFASSNCLKITKICEVSL